eukprot:c23546_g1_i1 orf=421-1449(+)
MDRLSTVNSFSALSLYPSSDLDGELEVLKDVRKSSVAKGRRKKADCKERSKASRRGCQTVVSKSGCGSEKAGKADEFVELAKTDGLVKEKESAEDKQMQRLEGETEAEKKGATSNHERSDRKICQAASRDSQPGQAPINLREVDGVEKPKKVADNTASGSLRWPLVWIDLEMTGLDIEKDRILEIACIVTDGKLVQMVEGPDLIINQSEEHLASMGEWCQIHHTASGLVEGVRKSKITEQEAEKQVLEFVHQHMGRVQPLLAGNSVYVDFMFLQKYMPNLAAVFSHVLVDVSSVKALCLRWFPKDAERAPVKRKQHRALEDIKESIAELKYMQKAIFKDTRR